MVSINVRDARQSQYLGILRCPRPKLFRKARSFLSMTITTRPKYNANAGAFPFYSFSRYSVIERRSQNPITAYLAPRFHSHSGPRNPIPRPYRTAFPLPSPRSKPQNIRVRISIHPQTLSVMPRQTRSTYTKYTRARPCRSWQMMEARIFTP
jgi:hypothetical protein